MNHILFSYHGIGSNEVALWKGCLAVPSLHLRLLPEPFVVAAFLQQAHAVYADMLHRLRRVVLQAQQLEGALQRAGMRCCQMQMHVASLMHACSFCALCDA